MRRGLQLVAYGFAIGIVTCVTALADDALPPGVPYASSTDPVRIAAVELPSDTVHGGDTVTATVLTTSNAAAVTAAVGRYVLDLPKTAPGTFELSLAVPRLPLPTYRAKIVVTAIRADGAQDQTTVSVKIKY
jgi:hypothetical protein